MGPAIKSILLFPGLNHKEYNESNYFNPKTCETTGKSHPLDLAIVVSLSACYSSVHHTGDICTIILKVCGTE